LNTFQSNKQAVKKTQKKHTQVAPSHYAKPKKEKTSIGFFDKLMSLKPRMRKVHFKERIAMARQKEEMTSLPFEKPVMQEQHIPKLTKKQKKQNKTKQNSDFASLLTKKLKMTSKQKGIEESMEHELPQIVDTKLPTPQHKTPKKKKNIFTSIWQKTTQSFSSLLPGGLGSNVKKEYYTGGKIRSKFVINDRSGESGLLYKYGYEGKITSTVHIKHGLKNGLETLYNNEGKILKRTPYVNGKKDGVVEVYYPSGKVLAQITYKNDIREGRASKYNQDGSVNEEVEFRHGRLIIEDDNIAIPTID